MPSQEQQEDRPSRFTKLATPEGEVKPEIAKRRSDVFFQLLKETQELEASESASAPPNFAGEHVQQ